MIGIPIIRLGTCRGRHNSSLHRSTPCHECVNKILHAGDGIPAKAIRDVVFADFQEKMQIN